MKMPKSALKMIIHNRLITMMGTIQMVNMALRKKLRNMIFILRIRASPKPMVGRGQDRQADNEGAIE